MVHMVVFVEHRLPPFVRRSRCKIQVNLYAEYSSCPRHKGFRSAGSVPAGFLRPTRAKENPVVVRTRSKLVASDFVGSIVRNVRQVVAVVIAGVVRDESKSSAFDTLEWRRHILHAQPLKSSLLCPHPRLVRKRAETHHRRCDESLLMRSVHARLDPPKEIRAFRKNSASVNTRLFDVTCPSTGRITTIPASAQVDRSFP